MLKLISKVHPHPLCCGLMMHTKILLVPENLHNALLTQDYILRRKN
jgi:hypothetical protein